MGMTRAVSSGDVLVVTRLDQTNLLWGSVSVRRGIGDRVIPAILREGNSLEEKARPGALGREAHQRIKWEEMSGNLGLPPAPGGMRQGCLWESKGQRWCLWFESRKETVG